jgi:tetratricopeptide (TPR) repeat protein
MLTHRLGVKRLAGDREATNDIIERCARLPLALAVAAARLATRPDLPLGTFADDLSHASAALDALHGGDPTTDVRTVFTWSYRTLSPAAARLFRLLGLHPGPDISVAAAASLAAMPVREARTLLAELVRGHLLAEAASARFGFHDLLRTYAAGQAHAHDGEDDRRAATHRMLDHYLHTASTATRLLTTRHPVELEAPQPGTTPESLDSAGAASAWFTREYHVLLAVIEHAAAVGFDRHVWQLVWAFRTFLNRRALYSVQIAVCHTALEAARRDNDPAGQARTHHGLALGYVRLGPFDDAEAHFHAALRLYTEVGDRVAAATVYHGLAELAEKQDRPADMLRHSQQMLKLYGELGDVGRYANAVNGVGWSYARLGDYDQALVHCQQAIGMLRELGDTIGVASTLGSLGYVHRCLADYEQALACYNQALETVRATGYRYQIAETLSSIGDTQHDAGRPQFARTAWQQALEILEDLDHPDAARVRAKLDDATLRRVPVDPSKPGELAVSPWTSM